MVIIRDLVNSIRPDVMNLAFGKKSVPISVPGIDGETSSIPNIVKSV
jgi:hypothetical protein